MTFTDNEQLEQWQQILILKCTSSEESATDDHEEVTLVKMLPW